MSERQSNIEPKSPERYLRSVAEKKLYTDNTPAEMLGVVASKGVFGDRGRLFSSDVSPLKTRVDIDGSSHVPSEGYQTLSFRTYRDNVPRWDLSRTGEVTDHEEMPTAIFWQDNTGKSSDEAGPVYQYGSEVPLSPDAVGALADEVRAVTPMREITHNRHTL